MVFPLLSAAAPIIGAGISAISGARAGRQNYEAQKEFAQNGISWKVADAQRAGIHPLYALGAGTTSFSPSYVGDSGAFASAGQDISRAASAASTAGDRAAVEALLLEKAGLENDLLRAQILKIRSSVGPPMPQVAANNWMLDGQGDSVNPVPSVDFDGRWGPVTDQPLRRVASAPGNPGMEPGAINDLGYSRTGRGYAPVPGQEIAERMEDNILASLSWMLRNQVLPSVGLNQRPPPVPVPGGYDAWVYDPFTQEYRPHRRGLFGIYY